LTTIQESWNLQDKVEYDGELWTEEYLIDLLFLRLASIKESVCNDKAQTLQVRKYYKQANDLMKWIPVSKPPPEFVINISDLTPRLIEELTQNITSKKKNRISYVLTQAVGRLFENLDFDTCHLSIFRNLRVKFEP
jgi:hypothetical protein